MAKFALTSTVTLTSGHKMPILGLGVYLNRSCGKAINAAIQAGYRHIDSAIVYKNEAEVGDAIRKAIEESGGSLKREDLFITSKVTTRWHGYNNTLKAVEESLERFKFDYLDLFLIHDPYSGTAKRLETWKALIHLKDQGKLRSIGVSNYGIHHLEEIKNAGLEVPSINQIELHPFCQQREIVDYCFQNQIVVQAYSPLTRGKRLDDETVEGIAKKHNKDPAQVLIRWSLQKGFVSLPKSSSPERVLSNSQVYDFELDAQDMEALNGLDEGAAGATSWHPVTAP